MNKQSSSNNLHNQYRTRGVTDITNALDESDLAPVQNIIFEKTKHLIEDHDASLTLSQKIALPFKSEPTDEDVRNVVQAVNESREIEELKQNEKIQNLFKNLFQSDDISLFPISKFRAQFPTIAKTSLNWHQDQGSWYAIPVKELAEVLPAIFWLSINGASAQNSIEIIPDSHHEKLRAHSFVSRQGYFNVDIPNRYRESEHIQVECLAGQGIAFHPLSYHRSIMGKLNKPRYSIDIRYFDENSNESYSVDLLFRLKRFMIGLKS